MRRSVSIQKVPDRREAAFKEHFVMPTADEKH
jgi:hypothetical protein